MNRLFSILWRMAILFAVLVSSSYSIAQETVEVRNGDHPNFSRIVFDWKEIVNYTPIMTSNQLEITFNKASIPNWSTLRNAPMKFLEGPDYHIDGNKLVVTLKVTQPSLLSHFRYENKIIFDVSGNAAALVTPEKIEVPERPVLPVVTEPVKKITLEPKGETLPSGSGLKLMVQSRWDNLRLSFPWTDNVGAAAFIRHNQLWVVFEGNRNVDQSELKKVLGQRVTTMRQIDHPTMTILLYEVIAGQNIKVQRVDGVWQIDLKNSPVAPVHSIPTSHQRVSGNRSENFFYSVDNKGAVVVLEDPVIGDNLAIVPTLGSSQGVLETQKFAEFESLATAQGIAVQLIADNLNVVNYPNGVGITSSDGLALSRNKLTDKLGLMDNAGQDTEFSGNLVDFSTWKKGPNAVGGRAGYHANKHELLYRLSNSTDSNRTEMRWKLAKFYLANGRVRESFGVLNVMLDNTPKLTDNPMFRAVLGVANILMRRYEDGAKLLAHKSLNAERDVFLWRAVADSALGKHKLAFENYKKGASSLSSHDSESQIRFLFSAIHSAYKLGDRDFVEFSLSFLQKLPLDEAQLTEVGYWQATLERDAGNILQAEETLQSLVRAGVRQTSAWAKFDLIDMSLKAKKIDATEAVDQLEKLRFAWRGDDFELDLLSRLGEIYVEQKEFNTGLQTLKLAITFFKGSKKTDELTRQMSTIYNDLFLNGGAKVLSPVKAVALYSDFQELIPLGKDGDTMTRRLADRLVSLDLLEEAAELLNHQIKFRLRGGAQSVVASRLAMIYLLDSRPEKALGILRATRISQIPDDVHNRRVMIEGRTLIELARYEEAEVLISSYKTEEAEEMRSDIYWKSENWAKYIAHENKLLDNRYLNDEALIEKERLSVLRLSVAYVINGDMTGVKDLRNKYKAHMESGLYGDTFEVITAERQLTDLNVGRLTRSIASVSKLETFMQSYKAEFSGQVAQN